MASFRLGVVLGFDSEVRLEIDGLRRALDSPQMSIVEPHITLSSPTNVDGNLLVSRLLALFRMATLMDSFEAEIGPSGSFRADKFVALLKVQSDFDLAKLSHAVRKVMGLGDPQYPFVPHVTLYDGATEKLVDAVELLFSGYRRRSWFDSLVIFRMNKKGAYAKFAEPILTGEFRSSTGGRLTRYYLLRGVGDVLSFLFDDDFYSCHVGEYGSHLALETSVVDSYSIVGFDEEENPVSFVTVRQCGAIVSLERIFVVEQLRGTGLSRGVLGALAFFVVPRGGRYLEVPAILCEQRLVSVLDSLGASLLSRGGDLYSDRYSLNLLNL